LPSTDADAWCLNRPHALQGIDRALHQDIRFKLDPVGGLRLDTVPERLKLRAERNFFLQAVHPLIPVFANVSLDLVG